MAIQEHVPEKYGPAVTAGTSDCESVAALTQKINRLSPIIGRLDEIDRQIDFCLCRIRGDQSVTEDPIGCSNEVEASIMNDLEDKLMRIERLVDSFETRVCELREYI